MTNKGQSDYELWIIIFFQNITRLPLWTLRFPKYINFNWEKMYRQKESHLRYVNYVTSTSMWFSYWIKHVWHWIRNRLHRKSFQHEHPNLLLNTFIQMILLSSIHQQTFRYLKEWRNRIRNDLVLLSQLRKLGIMIALQSSLPSFLFIHRRIVEIRKPQGSHKLFTSSQNCQFLAKSNQKCGTRAERWYAGWPKYISFWAIDLHYKYQSTVESGCSKPGCSALMVNIRLYWTAKNSPRYLLSF
jgi:hypothetical protein